MEKLPQISNIDDALVMRLINQIPIFAGMDIIEQHLVAQKCVIEHWLAEKIIIEEGHTGDRFYIILKGEVIVSKWNKSQGWLQVAKLGIGDFFGEIAIIRNMLRTARITTHTDCELLMLDNTDFLKIYANFPQKTRDNINFIVEKRLQELEFF
jgi:CRP/FNR family cyclic AMP-dependent transcriptional regulator